MYDEAGCDNFRITALAARKEKDELRHLRRVEESMDVACCFAILESATIGCRVSVEDVLSGKESTFQREIDEHYGF